MPVKLFLKVFTALFLLGFAASCDAPEPRGQSQTVKAGTIAQYKISGQHYTGEVTHAENGYALWKFTWKKTPVFEFKTYRGLLTVYSEEEGIKRWSKFDTRALDEFLPLRAGNEIVIEGRHYSKTNEEGYPFFVTITVRGKTVLMIKEKEYEAFILDYSVIEDHPKGQMTYTKTAWYSPELEAALRTDYRFDNGHFSMRVVAFGDGTGEDDDQENRPEGLGTTRL